MSLTYQLENWATFWADSKALREEQHAESPESGVPWDINELEYATAWLAGVLQILTARDGLKMVGYFVTFVRPATHCITMLVGYEDIYFLAKAYRKGLAGVRLIKEAEGHLQAMGVQRMVVQTWADSGVDRLFERLGFGLTHLVFSKDLVQHTDGQNG